MNILDKTVRNVIIVNDHAHVTGGAAEVAISSVLSLLDKGVGVGFVSAVGSLDSRIDVNRVQTLLLDKKELIKDQNKVRASIKGLWDSNVARQINSYLKPYDRQNTIIHLHTWTKALSPSVVSAVLKAGFKLVCTLHDYFVVCPNGGLYDYNFQSPCALTPMSPSCLIRDCDSRSFYHKAWRVGRQFIQKYMANMPSEDINFICVSDFSGKIIKKYLPDNSRMFFVNNPVNIEKMAPVDPGINQEFSYVGRITAEKGVTLFAEAASRINLRAHFVGSGDLEDSVKAIFPRAVLSGWLQKNEVSQLIRRSRALVLPSLWYETQGLVVKEAAAMGVPAIVSDGCAGRDSVEDGVTGLWFSSGNVDDLVEKINILKEDHRKARTLGMNAYRKYWDSPNTVQNHGRDLMNCYNAILFGE